MTSIKTTGVAIAVTCGLVALSSAQVSAQAPTVTWRALDSTTLRVEWTPLAQATSYEVFVEGASIGRQGPFPVLTAFFQVRPVPPGTYLVAIRGRAGGVVGPLSSPITVTMGGPSAGCSITAPSVTTSTSGSVVTASWGAVAGAIGYRLQLGTAPGATQVSGDVPATQTSYSASIPATGTFYLRVMTANVCGASATSTEQSFTIGSSTPGPPPPVPGRPRTPDPAPGQVLPLPGYAQQVVIDIANAFRGDLYNSCVEHGGNNVFLFRVVQALRQRDTRWGLNWKRGNRGDMSQDIVTYNFGSGPDEDTTNVYIVDVISGHCGGSPDWNWQDVTQATRDGGGIGRWTLQPYLRAGLPAEPRQ
jgi:hypothetical protein